MMPTTAASYPAAPISVTFSGTVNTGTIVTPITLSANSADANDDFNLIGNPYPSALDADAFIDANPNISGSLYFWTHVGAISVSNPGPDAQNFISDDYAVYNKTGGTRTSYTGSALPNGKIGTGQAFMVEAVTPTNVQFANNMRNKTYTNAQFFRFSAATETVEQPTRDRFWLNLKNTDGMFSQLLIGYLEGASMAEDRAFDALAAKTKNYLSFYSLIDDKNYRIQARPSFAANDQVPLGYFAAVSGVFSIELDATEGIFDNQNQPIYLEDREQHILHDLTQSTYTFTTSSGTFNSRFILRYSSELTTNPVDSATQLVQVYGNENQIHLRSVQDQIESVSVFDLVGRTIYKQLGILDTTFSFQAPIRQSVVLVQVQLKSGKLVTQKIAL
jgi:hypothetical protein